MLAPHFGVMTGRHVGARIKAGVPPQQIIFPDLILGKNFRRFQVRRKMDIPQLLSCRRYGFERRAEDGIGDP